MDSGYVIWALKFLFFDTVYGSSFSPIIDIVFLLSGKRELSGGWFVWSFTERLKKHWSYVYICSAGILFMLFFQQKEQRFMPYVVSQLARPRLFLGICMIPLGLFSYMFYLHRLTGDSLAFMRIQRVWGRDIENPVKVLFSNLKAALAGNAGITFILIWCVAAVVLLLYLLSRRHYVEFAIGSVFYWICLSAGIQSMQRYIIGSFVFVLSMTDELLEMRRMNRYIVLGVLFF